MERTYEREEGKEFKRVKDAAKILEDLGKVYRMLEDEESKFIYINKLNYLVTGEIKYIKKIVRRCMPEIPVYDRTKKIPYLIANLPSDRPIVVYGVGQDAEKVIEFFKKIDNLFGFCDKNKEKQRLGFHGYKVISPEELLRMNDVCILICSRQYGGEIKEYLRVNGINEKDIYDIRQYLLMGSENAYFGEEFLTYSDSEIFIDAGCNDLSTTIRLAGICSGLKKVYAFEPDFENYKRCQQNLEKKQGILPETVLLQKGVWSCKAALNFCARANAASHLDENGSNSVEVISIDEAVKSDDCVTFIKMDVEGAELEALKGASTVIQKNKPKCAICIYHKIEDMITIPLYLKALVPEYKLYVRHYSNSAGETVLFAVV